MSTSDFSSDLSRGRRPKPKSDEILDVDTLVSVRYLEFTPQVTKSVSVAVFRTSGDAEFQRKSRNVLLASGITVSHHIGDLAHLLNWFMGFSLLVHRQ